MLKSKVGMPAVQFSGQKIDLAGEARRARRRLYPATVLYSTYATALLVLALRSKAPAFETLAFYAAGLLAWTFVEYLAHRYVLHYRFPDGPGPVQHWLHSTFDNLHTVHHARPWGPYRRYITRHHAYHHSPRGAELAFGLTNGFWDVVFGTRVPERDRRLLYGGVRRAA